MNYVGKYNGDGYAYFRDTVTIFKWRSVICFYCGFDLYAREIETLFEYQERLGSMKKKLKVIWLYGDVNFRNLYIDSYSSSRSLIAGTPAALLQLSSN